MKLTKNMRSDLAEKICRRWIKRRGIRLAAPKVYVVNRVSRGIDDTWGKCSTSQKRLILHIGIKSNRRDQMILLAHEFTHYLDFSTTPRHLWRKVRPHGDRFQILLWKTLAKGLWKRASKGRWIYGSSAHRPEFQIT